MTKRTLQSSFYQDCWCLLPLSAQSWRTELERCDWYVIFAALVQGSGSGETIVSSLIPKHSAGFQTAFACTGILKILLEMLLEADSMYFW